MNSKEEWMEKPSDTEYKKNKIKLETVFALVERWRDLHTGIKKP